MGLAFPWPSCHELDYEDVPFWVESDAAYTLRKRDSHGSAHVTASAQVRPCLYRFYGLHIHPIFD